MKSLPEESHFCYRRITPEDTMWNAKGGWIKKPGEFNVFDITLHDIIALDNPLRVISIFGKEPDKQYPVGCSVLFLRDLLRRFGISYKSLSKAQCLERLAAKKLNLPMPEFDNHGTESGGLEGDGGKKRAHEKPAQKSTKRPKQAAQPSGDLSLNNDAAPSTDKLLEALTALNCTNNQSPHAGPLIQSLTAYYRDRRVMELQSHYWSCLDRVKDVCAKYNIDWDAWQQTNNYETPHHHPDCIEARRQLQETQQRLEQARALQDANPDQGGNGQNQMMHTALV